jgi:hypothetical protein
VAKGEARYRLILDGSDFEKGLKGAEAAFVGTTVAIAAGGTAIAAGLVGATASALAYSDQIVTMSQKTHLSTESLQSLKFAAGQTGTSLDSVAGGAGKLMKNLGEGSASTSSAVKSLGLSMTDLRNASPEKSLSTVLEKISGIANPSQQAAVAASLLGKSFADLLPLGNELGGLTQRAHELGLVLGDSDLKAAESLGDSFDGLMAASGGVVNSFGIAIASNESLKTVVDFVATSIGEFSQYVYANKDALSDMVDQGIDLVIDGIGILLDVVDGMVDAWGLVSPVLEVVGDVMGVVGKAAFDLADIVISTLSVGFIDLGETVQNSAMLWDGLKLLWTGLKGAAVELAIATLSVKKAMMFDGDPLKAQADADITALKGLKIELGDEAKAIVDGTAAKKESGTVTDGARKKLDELRAALDKTTTGQKAVTQTTRDNVPAFNDSAAATAKAAKEMADYEKAIDAFNKKNAVMGPTVAQVTGIEQLHTTALKEGLATLREKDGAMIHTKAIVTDLGLSYKDEKDALTALAGEEAKAKHEAFDFQKALAAVKDTMSVLGIASDSTFATIVGGMTAAAAAGQQMHGAIKSGDVAGMMQSGAQFLGSYMSSIDKRTAGARALGGGATAGMAAYQATEGLPPAIRAAVTGAAAIGGALFGALHKPGWVKEADMIGEKWGVTISDGLAREIETTHQDLHIGGADAALLSLVKIADEGGKEMRTFAGGTAQLMAGIANGTIPAKAGLAALGQQFQVMRDEAQAAGRVGDAAMVAILRGAREVGQVTPEMSAAVAQSLGVATEGANKFTAGLAAVGETSKISGTDAATSFMAVFNALAGEQGVMGAVTALKGSFGEFKDKMIEVGGDGAAAILDPMTRMFELVSGPMGGLIEASDGLRQMIIGVADAGYLDINSFGAMQRSAADLFDQMVDGGVSGSDAIRAIAPTIQAAISAAEQMGVPLDADMERLKGIAEQNGIAFKTDPMHEMLDVLKDIAAALGAVPRQIEVHTTYTESGNPPGNTSGSSSGGGSKNYGGANGSDAGDDYPGFAVGGVINAPTSGALAMLHGREAIVPLDRPSVLGDRLAGGGTDDDLRNAILAMTAQMASMGRDLARANRDLMLKMGA